MTAAPCTRASASPPGDRRGAGVIVFAAASSRHARTIAANQESTAIAGPRRAGDVAPAAREAP